MISKTSLLRLGVVSHPQGLFFTVDLENANSVFEDPAGSDAHAWVEKSDLHPEREAAPATTAV